MLQICPRSILMPVLSPVTLSTPRTLVCQKNSSLSRGRQRGKSVAALVSEPNEKSSAPASSETEINGASVGGSALWPTPGIQPLNAKEFREHAHRMVDFIADYYERVESFPVRSQVQPGYLQPLIPESAPDQPESLESVLDDVTSKILPGITHWQSPGFFAYYPANSSTAGFLGDMLSGALNVIGFSWISSPAATELETIVLDWLGKLLQLPSVFLSTNGTGGGSIQGTASEAVLVAILAARTRAISSLMAADNTLTHSQALSKLVAYSSDQAHSSIKKAGIIACLPRPNIRFITVDATTLFALSPASLDQAMAEDVAAGLVPFFVCANVGTTSSAAVDPIAGIAEVARQHGAWLHVDAAYAGSACICPEIRGGHLDGLEGADSFNMNAHKWLLTNFDCSCLWVKDAKAIVAALSTTAEFLRNQPSDDNLVIDYKDWQVPLGRRFRALKLWFVIRLYGAEGLRTYIRSHIELAQRFEALVRADSRFEVMAPRFFSLICFRLRAPGADLGTNNDINARLLDAINEDGTAFLTHTMLSGVFTLRMAIGGTRTELHHVEQTWQLICDKASYVLHSTAAPPQ